MGGGPQPPPSVYLSWKPNFIDPKTRGPSAIILEAVLLGTCYILVALRVWARAIQRRNFGLDDAAIIVNLIPLTGLGVCLWLGYARYGWNKHVWDNPVPVLMQSRQIILGYEMLYTLSTAITKISVLLFYRRLASGSLSNHFRYAIYAAMASVIMFLVSFGIVNWAACAPLHAVWKEVDPAWRIANKGKYHCADEGAIIIASAAISMIQDFLACALPMALFWKRKISRRQKLALTAIFSVGYLLCICAILRVVFVVRIYYYTYDMTWESQNIWFTTIIESHLAVVCASVPALHHFFKHTFQSSNNDSRLKSFPSGRGGYEHSRSNANSDHDDYVRQERTSQQTDMPLVQDVQLEEYYIGSVDEILKVPGRVRAASVEDEPFYVLREM